jgi:hypothetical protein
MKNFLFIFLFFSKITLAQKLYTDNVFAIPSPDFDTLYLLKDNQLSYCLYDFWIKDTVYEVKPKFYWTETLPNYTLRTDHPRYYKYCKEN